MRYKKEFTLSVSCFLLSLLFFMIWVGGTKENLAERISPHILRLHVIANSNSPKDQELKLKVKELLLTEIYRFSEINDLDGNSVSDVVPTDNLFSAKEALCGYIQKNQAPLVQKARALLNDLGYPYEIRLQVTKTIFPAKAYGDLILPRGTYDAVQVSIGKARGRNWWCVIYPRLCFLDATHGIVPEDSKQQLQTLLGKEDYALFLDDRPLGIQVRFRLLEIIRSAFSDK